MALTTSGQLSLNDINVEAGNSSGTQASLRSLSSGAGFSTPDSISEFYGWTSGSISLSITNSSATSSDLLINTITSTGAWTAAKADPDNIISSYNTSGAGSGKLTVSTTGLISFFERVATITYTLTSDTSKKAYWTITIPANY